MAAEYYKIDVEIRDNDTLEGICDRFDQNSQKLYAICIAALKQLAIDPAEKVIIAAVEEKYQTSRKDSSVEERLEKFTITTKEYRSNIMQKDEAFFKNLGNILLDERKADIDKYVKDASISIPINTDLLIEKVKALISRIDTVDSKCKSDIWRIMCNLIKLTEKYRIVKGYDSTQP